MRKYIDYIVIGINEHLVYPSAIWAKLFSKIIYLYLQLSIWTALFSSYGQMNPLLNREDTLKYIIVATIISALIDAIRSNGSMPRFRRGISLWNS